MGFINWQGLFFKVESRARPSTLFFNWRLLFRFLVFFPLFSLIERFFGANLQGPWFWSEKRRSLIRKASVRTYLLTRSNVQGFYGSIDVIERREIRRRLRFQCRMVPSRFGLQLRRRRGRRVDKNDVIAVEYFKRPFNISVRASPPISTQALHEWENRYVERYSCPYFRVVVKKNSLELGYHRRRSLQKVWAVNRRNTHHLPLCRAKQEVSYPGGWGRKRRREKKKKWRKRERILWHGVIHDERIDRPGRDVIGCRSRQPLAFCEPVEFDRDQQRGRRLLDSHQGTTDRFPFRWWWTGPAVWRRWTRPGREWTTWRPSSWQTSRDLQLQRNDQFREQERDRQREELNKIK